MPASPTTRRGGSNGRGRFTARRSKGTRDMPRHCIFLGSLLPINAVTLPRRIVLIERALPELHDLPEAHLNFGNALREMGRLVEAVNCYRRAIALDPDYGKAHSNLARALNDQGLFEPGRESCKRAVELIPDFLGAQANRAAALLGLERFREAEVPLRRAFELAPERRRSITISARSWRRSVGSTRRRRAIAVRWLSALISPRRISA
jgi:tetratricopeptide (TPR) repeat protein